MESMLKREHVQPEAGAWNRTVATLFVVAVVAAAASAFGFFRDREQFAFSYLVSFAFFLSLSLAGLFFVMLQHLTRAGWSVAVRRVAESMGMTVPAFVILFLPVALGIHDLYHWSHADVMEHDALLRHKEPFLNSTFFLVRAAVYFVVWGVLARYFYVTSVRQDQSRDPRLTVVMQRRSAPGMVLFAFTLTFMSFDWIMSLDPHWYSTIFGVYIFSGSALAGFAVIFLVVRGVQGAGYLRDIVRLDHYRDLGRLLFAFTVFWAYIAFSQYFLIWYGNIPEETVFFVDRLEGSWRAVTMVLAAGHFGVPFLLLMSRWTKNKPAIIGLMAVWILVMHYLDVYWLIMPVLHREGVRLNWMDFACMGTVGAVFLALLIRQLGSRPLVPVGDPRLAESLRFQSDY